MNEINRKYEALYNLLLCLDNEVDNNMHKKIKCQLMNNIDYIFSLSAEDITKGEITHWTVDNLDNIEINIGQNKFIFDNDGNLVRPIIF